MMSVGPAKLSPPPRQVRRRSGWMGENNNGCLMVFMIPFVLVGIGMIVAVPARLLVQSRGTPVVVTIDGKDFSRSSKNNSRTYFVEYHYYFEKQINYDRQQVTLAEYNRARKGGQASGRVMRFGSSIICISNVGNPNTNTKFFVLFAVLWNGFISFFLYFTWGAMIRQKRLVRDGMPAAGTIVGHRMVRGKSASYSIVFTFTTSEGAEITNRVGVSKKSYDVASVGEGVTVLYDPEKPKRSVVYEYCNYEVVPMVG